MYMRDKELLHQSRLTRSLISRQKRIKDLTGKNKGQGFKPPSASCKMIPCKLHLLDKLAESKVTNKKIIIKMLVETGWLTAPSHKSSSFT